MRNAIRIFLFIALFALSVNIVSANIEVEGISFNPAIIAAGDEVDITVNFREMKPAEARLISKRISQNTPLM